MKLTKLSVALIAAAGMCASASAAVENVKFDGQAKLIYQTADWELLAGEEGLDTGLLTDGDMLGAGASYGGSAGGAALTLGVTADVADAFSFGVEVQGASSLGLEHNMVNNVMFKAAALSGYNVSQAYVAKAFGNTTVKVGRQELNTPLLFTEKWNLAKNTFESAVVLNNDLPNTTLVGAYVGRHNGATSGYTAQLDNQADEGSSPFYTAGTDGAYAFGVVNSSIADTTLQGWYYDVSQVATAIWLQGDTNVAGIKLGAQYATLDPEAAGADTATIMAVKAAADVSGINVYGAFSTADEDGAAGFQNVSTGDKTKIYTGTSSIYMDGVVTAPGATAWKIGASTKLGGAKLAASYASATDVAGDNNDISAFDVVASTTAAGVGLKAIFTSVSNDSTMYAGRDTDTLRIYATLPF